VGWFHGFVSRWPIRMVQRSEKLVLFSVL
jgi:hypothetical protein